MILDTFDHGREAVAGLPHHERFEAGVEFLRNLAPDAPDGRHEIDGDRVFCMVQTYETQKKEGREFEAHRDYADIQCLLKGVESILWAPVDKLTVTKKYETDYELYSLTENMTEIVLTPGRFCVLLPRDAHAPCVAYQGIIVPARKAVVKVSLVL